MKIRIEEGQMIPKFYGVAYRDYDTLYAICYPIPLNIFMGLWNKILIWFKHGHKLYENGYTKGHSEGKRLGREYAFNQYKKMILRDKLEEIIKRFIDEQERIISVIKENPKEAEGWIYKFIHKEEKKLYES